MVRFRKIFLFELKYQLRSVPTWIYFTISLLFPFLLSINNTPDEGVYLNGPYFLITVTVFSSALWLLMTGAIAGHAASRDVAKGMHPLVYTVPVSKSEYLGGRFFAAFVLNALINLTIPVGFFLSFYIPDADPTLLAPFRLDMYLTAYFYLSLPLAFVVTACQFSVAVVERKTIASYIITIILFPISSHFIALAVAKLAGEREIWNLIDLIGISIAAGMDVWTPFEKNTRLLKPEGTFLWNRILWLGIAAGFLAYAYVRFQFIHPVEKTNRIRIFRRRKAMPPKASGRQAHTDAAADKKTLESTTLSVPNVNPAFNLTTHFCQARTIAWSSFRMIAKNKVGLAIIAVLAFHLVVFGGAYLTLHGVPPYPTTMRVLTLLTASLSDLRTPLIIIPILIIFFAGELVWREREAGLNKISDTLPVSEWVLFLGKFSGLGLIILLWLGILMMAGILFQVTNSYTNFEVGVYLKALFGFQLTSYLLFALLTLVVHVIVNQKYLGHLAMLIVYAYIGLHSRLGIEHNMLVYGSDPGWLYTDMRGFEPYLKPWLWFKLYWTGWAILLAVVARLLWVRSMSKELSMRIQLIRHRFTHATAWTAAIAVVIILFSGGYIFYNTNVLNDYATASDRTEQRIRYEQNYRKYKNIPQPLLTGIRLHVELYPSQKKADIRGTYSLINKTDVAIDSIHVATAWGLETAAVTFDRPSSHTVEDKDPGHQIHVLKKPLQPGDSLSLSFEVHFNSQGFSHNGVDVSVIGNGTYFINEDWLPAIGYQSNRELRDNGSRKKYGLAPWAFPSLYDTASANRQIMAEQELTRFEAVIGTDENQIAVAPGMLLRKWKENPPSRGATDGQAKRSYFHYATSAPIGNKYSFFSADYIVHETKWRDSLRDVAISLYYHRSHADNIDRMVQSVQASLAYYTKKFGPYPYSHIAIVERSGHAGQLNAEATTIDYGESFTLSNLRDNPRALDIIYFALAHEVAHQWWGAAQLRPAHVEGEPVLSETLANYSALKVVEQNYGNEQVQKLLAMWRDSYEVPRSRAMAPLLQALDPFLHYRKGPLAFYALTRYAGKERVNDALRQLIQKHGSAEPPLPTSLDLYRELKAVTPDSLHYLLQDYFEKNIYWQLKTEQANARQIDSGRWQVTLKVHALKVVVDSTGAEISVPMNDWVEVGIFAPWEKGETSGKPLHLQKHRIRSGEQTITVTVPGKPGRAGIDPHYLLLDLNPDNNTRRVKIE